MRESLKEDGYLPQKALTPTPPEVCTVRTRDLSGGRFDALKDTANLRNQLSELHAQLAAAKDGAAKLHSDLESAHAVEREALVRAEEEADRAHAEASGRRKAEEKLRSLEADVRDLANTNKSARFLQDAESSRSKMEREIASLRQQLAKATSALGTSLGTSALPPTLAQHSGHSQRWATPLRTAVAAAGAAAAGSGDSKGSVGVAGSGLGSAAAFETPAAGPDRPPARSPREAELEEVVGDLRSDVLEMSEALLRERCGWASKLEECLEIVEDAELEKDAAKELGLEAVEEAARLKAALLKSGLLERKLAKCESELQETRSQLHMLTRENEVLRSKITAKLGAHSESVAQASTPKRHPH